MTSEPTDINTRPRWARLLADRKRPLSRPVLPFDALDRVWKAQEAVSAGAAAALAIGLNNLVIALVRSGARHPAHWTVAKQFDVSRPFLCVVAGLIALTLAARLKRTASPVLAVWVLVWSLCDLLMANFFLYGTAPFGGIGALVCLMAFMGVRGALRLKRFAREGEPAEAPVPPP